MRLLSPRSFGPILTFLSPRRCRVEYHHSFIHQQSQFSTTTSLHMSSSSAKTTDKDAKKPQNPVIAQYIFLRRDLDWPAGAMAAQAAHASVAAITKGLAANHEATATYVSADNLPHMTKMVYGVDDQSQLEQVKKAWNKLIQSLEEGNDLEGDCLQAYWWVEQPENVPTAMATWPIIRTNKVSKVIKNLKLSYF